MKKPNKLFGRSAAVLCAAGIAFSTYTIAASAEERTCPSGLSFDKIETYIERLTETDSDGTNSPSLSAVVFCGEEILYTGFFGETDLENHIPADENTVYEWGSISKTMIWVSAMQLWEQGKLDLDADIRSYLPDDFFKKLSYDDPITMTNLMNHEGGWCETTYSISTEDENDIPTLEEALRMTEPAQTYRPGEVAAYSNWGAALAAYIVERISGMDYCEYVHKNILEPLGMEHTAVSASHRDNEWVREQRCKLKSYRLNVLTQTYEFLGNRMSYITLYPSGSATGTIGDLAKYAQAFVDDNAPLFKNKETQDKLFSGSAFYGGSDIPSHSFGFGVVEYAARTFGHDGATVSCISYMFFDRESKTGLVALTNELTGDKIYAGNLIYKAIPTWIFGKLSPDKYSDGKAEPLPMPPFTEKEPQYSSETKKSFHTETARNGEPFRLDGYYLNSRSRASGLLKFYSYLTAVPAENLEGISLIGDGLCQLSDGETAMLMGVKTYSDGSMGFNLGASELIPEKMYILKLCALTAFFMTAAASVFLLLIKLKMKMANKLQSYTGIGVITAGQAAKIISMAAVAALVSFASMEETYGLSKTVGISAGTVQILCMAVCVIAALVSAYALIAKKPVKLNKIRYIFNIAGNALTVFVIAYFEMYKFWGC